MNLEETSASTLLDSTSTSDDRNVSEEDSAETGIVYTQKASAVWILKTQELHRLPLSVMDAVMVDIQLLYDISLQNKYHCVTSVLRDAKVDTFTLNKYPTSSLQERKYSQDLKHNHNK